jgi:geranylgeranyl transferase type-2 subunit alpha
LIRVGGVSPSSEFDFSTRKISENFSNYSAFHHRSVFLRATISGSSDSEESLLERLREEYSIVESAVFTEPDDQSAWWYYRFLVQLFVSTCISQGTSAGPRDSSWLLEELCVQKEAMASLHEMEPHSKWPLIAMLLLLDSLRTLLPASAVVMMAEGRDTEWLSERSQALGRLCALDPTHLRSYLHRLSLSGAGSCGDSDSK